ncbi:hypothetical protein HYPSUDRAFT_53535 [Hypholoma sublateritium FD-334 SS-4]|uniref:Uncharacterized protein n=1 Tax=Hypholoma sublateritium (strain FD-334 SS-4) TaxID=945553 RepID=A0A0D2P7X7_HYPSF|nr:hypothetical protein HYPSUDRAFT_53535 [Hypholoma sublateritium FD-334 SS-4]
MHSKSGFSGFQSDSLSTPSLTPPAGILKHKRDDTRAAFETADKEIARLHAPGGSLDSQMSDTQWVANAVSFADSNSYLERDLEDPYDNGLGTRSQPFFVESQTQESDQEPENEADTVGEDADPFLVKNICKIIDLYVENALENRSKSETELHLEVQCQKLDAKLLADVKRRKLLEQDLAREREWTQCLEKCLRNSGIPYPLYPSFEF